MQQSDRTIEQATDVGKLLFVSLLVMLNLPIVFTLIMRLDHYSLATLPSVSPIVQEWYGPYALASIEVAIGVVLASMAYMLYKWLHRNSSNPMLERWSAFYCHILAIGLPITIAMLPGVLLTVNNGKPYGIIIGALLTGGLSVIAACSDDRINISSNMASLYFVSSVIGIIALLAMAVQWTFFLYGAEQVPSTTNSFWKWEPDWQVVGYTKEEFAQRNRDCLLIFAIAGCVYMTLVGIRMLHALGGRIRGDEEQGRAETDGGISFVGLIRTLLGFPGAHSHGETSQSDEVEKVAAPKSPAYPPLPEWGVEVLRRLQWRQGDADDYFVAFDGAGEVGIDAKHYESLLDYKDSILSEADLLVNKAAADAYTKVEGRWHRLRFRPRRGTAHGLSGPLSMLSVCAQNPRHRFEPYDLRRKLEDEMRERSAINVADFRNGLMARKVRLDDGREVDAIPLEYDEKGNTYIRDDVKVCFIYRNTT